MSPSEIMAQTQAQDEPVLDSVDDEGDGEVDRSQLEAKDDAALLVRLSCRTLFHAIFMQDIC